MWKAYAFVLDISVWQLGPGHYFAAALSQRTPRSGCYASFV